MKIIVDWMPSMLKALLTTVSYALLVWGLSFPLALPVALMRISRSPIGLATKVYINLMRGKRDP